MRPGAESGTESGCPYGAVCVYSGSDLSSSITYTFWSYGPHNLSAQYGKHAVLNNQYGDATASLCKGYNGTNCEPELLGAYEYCYCWIAPDLTPINSITLNRP